MELLVEGFAFRQHGVDDRGEFLGNECARDGFTLPPLPPLKLRLHCRAVLDRANSGVMERDLQIPIAVT